MEMWPRERKSNRAPTHTGTTTSMRRATTTWHHHLSPPSFAVPRLPLVIFSLLSGFLAQQGPLSLYPSASTPPLVQQVTRTTTSTRTISMIVATSRKEEDVLARGHVEFANNLDNEVIDAVLGKDSALFVTARAGSRGPVIASQKITQPSFPLDFVLDVEDLYANTEEEKRSLLASVAKTDLFVAARLDKDGVASTRDPEDLVGSSTVYKFQTDNPRQWSRADVKLQGRGAFGKWATTKR